MKKIIYPISTIVLAVLVGLLSWGIFAKGWFGYHVPNSNSDPALEQEIEDLRSQLAEAEAERDIANSDRDTAISDKEKAEAERDALQQSLNELLGQITDFNNQIKTLNNQLTTANGEKTNLSNQLTNLNYEIESFLRSHVFLHNIFVAYLAGEFENANDGFVFLQEEYPFLDFDIIVEFQNDVLYSFIENINKLADTSFELCALVLSDYFSDDYNFDTALEFLRGEFIPEDADSGSPLNLLVIFNLLSYVLGEIN